MPRRLDGARAFFGGPPGDLWHSLSSFNLPLNWSARDRIRTRVRRTSATAANILQLCGGSRLFRNEWVLVPRRRVDNRFRGFPRLWRKRRVIAGKASVGALDGAAIGFCGSGGNRRCAQCRCQHCRSYKCSNYSHAEYPIAICSCLPRTASRRSKPEENPTRTNASGAPHLRLSRRQRAHRPGPFSNQRRSPERRRHP